jgi:hypothetical protein
MQAPGGHQISGNHFTGVGNVYCHGANNVNVVGNTFQGSTGMTFACFWIDATDAAASGYSFSNNRLIGGYDNSAVMLHSPNAQVISDVLISGNNSSGMDGSAGMINMNVTSRLTQLKNIRVEGNWGTLDPDSGGSNAYRRWFNIPITGGLETNMTWTGPNSGVWGVYPYLQWAFGLVYMNATGAAKTFELPDATIVGRGYKIRIGKQDASGNTVTVSGYTGQTINGAASVVLATQYKYVEVMSDGGNWGIVAQN